MMMPAKSILSVVVLFAAAAAEPCLAQISTLTRVEQGYSDIEPILQSLRVQPVDMRESVGFDILYKGTWNDPAVGSREVFARRHGALTAVFPRSSYVRTKEGVVPEIPAGTIFYFGDLPPTLDEVVQRQEAARAVLGSLNGRRDLRLDTALPINPQDPQDPQGSRDSTHGQTALDPDIRLSIWTSESYRQIRVARLIRAASAAEHRTDEPADEPAGEPAVDPASDPARDPASDPAGNLPADPDA